VVDEVTAPDEMPAEAAVGDGDDVDVLVGQQRERDDEALVALAAGDGAADEALPEESRMRLSAVRATCIQA